MSTTTTSSPDGDPSQFVIELTQHCLERYSEHFRHRPFVIGDDKELASLIQEDGEVVLEAPDGVSPDPTKETTAWVVIRGMFALPLVEGGDVLRAPTVIPAGGISHAERDRRNAERDRACERKNAERDRSGARSRTRRSIDRDRRNPHGQEEWDDWYLDGNRRSRLRRRG